MLEKNLEIKLKDSNHSNFIMHKGFYMILGSTQELTKEQDFEMVKSYKKALENMHRTWGSFFKTATAKDFTNNAEALIADLKKITLQTKEVTEFFLHKLQQKKVKHNYIFEHAIAIIMQYTALIQDLYHFKGPEEKKYFVAYVETISCNYTWEKKLYKFISERKTPYLVKHTQILLQSILEKLIYLGDLNDKLENYQVAIWYSAEALKYISFVKTADIVNDLYQKSNLLLSGNDAKNATLQRIYLDMSRAYMKLGQLKVSNHYSEEAFKYANYIYKDWLDSIQDTIKYAINKNKYRFAYIWVSKFYEVTNKHMSALSVFGNDLINKIERQFMQQALNIIKKGLRVDLAQTLGQALVDNIAKKLPFLDVNYLDNYELSFDWSGYGLLTQNEVQPLLERISLFKFSPGKVLIIDSFKYSSATIEKLYVNLCELIQRKLRPEVDRLTQQLSAVKVMPVPMTPPPSSGIEIDVGSLDSRKSKNSNLWGSKNDDDTKKKKEKGKSSVRVPSTVQQSVTKPQNAPKTAKLLGFIAEGEADFPIYDIGNERSSIQRGVYYAFGLKLDLPEKRLDERQIAAYQRILEEGNVVSDGSKGLRVVLPSQSGLAYPSFKIADPSKDLRILLIKERTIKTSKGKEIHLYRAGNVKFHRTRKNH